MTLTRAVGLVATAIGLAAIIAALPQPAQTVQAGANDITGVVKGPRGPEAGVIGLARLRNARIGQLDDTAVDDNRALFGMRDQDGRGPTRLHSKP